MKNLVDKFTIAGTILGITIGLAAGLGAYTFIYTKGGSYNPVAKLKLSFHSSARRLQARNFQRRAQFLLDFIEAENSTGFHAPQEAAWIWGLSIDYSRQGQVALRAQMN